MRRSDVAPLESQHVWYRGGRCQGAGEEAIFAGGGLETAGVCWDGGVVFGGDEVVGPLVGAEVLDGRPRFSHC